MDCSQCGKPVARFDVHCTCCGADLVSKGPRESNVLPTLEAPADLGERFRYEGDPGIIREMLSPW